MTERRTGNMAGTFVEEFSGKYPEGLWVQALPVKRGFTVPTMNYPDTEDTEYTSPRMIEGLFFFATEEGAASNLERLREAEEHKPRGLAHKLTPRRLSWLDIVRYTSASNPDRIVLARADGREDVLSQRHAQQD